MDAPLDLEMSLTNGGAWRRISVTRDFRIASHCGGEADLPAQFSDNLLDLFDQPGRTRVAGMLAGGGRGTAASGVALTRDGIPLEILLLDEDTGITVLYRDITERVRQHERLAVFYRHFLTTPIAIVITDPQGSIIDANRSFLDLYGYHLEEVLGNNPRILKSGRQSPAAYREMWRQIADQRVGSWTGELINRRKNGEEIAVLLTVSAVRRAEGALIGYIASALDITRKKLLERELQASNDELKQLSALKSDFMAITSHDLKAPINSIISRARLVRDQAGELTGGKLAEHMDRITEAGANMTAFINDLLDLEKIESGRFHLNTGRVHLDVVLRSCVETNSPTAEAKGIHISLKTEGAAGPVIADAIKMEQVFNNILSNAVKFSPPGGQIEAGYCDRGPGIPKVIEVADRGPGIPEDEIDKIFDKYYQVKKKGGVAKRAFGAGLGLNIVKNIVGLHGGRIRAANRPGGGCLFTIEMPGKRSLSSGRDMAAVVADPRAGISGFLEGPLRNKEVSCFIAASADETRRLCAYEQPEILFLDASAASGELLGFIRSLRQEGKAPLIVAVGNEDHGNEDGLYDRWLVVPVVDLEIYELLREVQLNGPERVT